MFLADAALGTQIIPPCVDIQLATSSAKSVVESGSHTGTIRTGTFYILIGRPSTKAPAGSGDRPLFEVEVMQSWGGTQIECAGWQHSKGRAFSLVISVETTYRPDTLWVRACPCP